MYEIITQCGPAAKAKLTQGDLEVVLPQLIHLSEFNFSKSPVLIMDSKPGIEKGNIYWGGNELLFSEVTTEHPVFIPAHIPYPPSINKVRKEDHLSFPLNEEQKIFVVLNGPMLSNDPRALANAISNVQKASRTQDLIYLPGLASPKTLAVLAYAGVDLFDTQEAIKAGLRGEYWLTGPPYVSKYDGKTVDKIIKHNIRLLEKEIDLVKTAIGSGSIRTLVEQRVSGDNHAMALLRNLDKEHYSMLESSLSTVGQGKFDCPTKECLGRPSVKRWFERLESRYEKPESPNILLLLPCSARKPYSRSKTHKKFLEVIRSFNNSTCIHEVIITSPLGVVPRELEQYFPANSYDIPVTGEWDEMEKEMIRRTLSRYLEINQYDKVIVHFPDLDLIEPILKEHFSEIISTCVDHRPASNPSLERLSKALGTALMGIEPIPFKKRNEEDMRCRSSFQFSKAFTDELPDFKVQGRYPFQKMVGGSGQIGMLVPERGAISLTMLGAKVLKEAGIYLVEIEDFIPKGSLFAVGVTGADPNIRPGDDVAVVHNGELRAVGSATMSGKQMVDLNRGGAVSIRHHIK